MFVGSLDDELLLEIIVLLKLFPIPGLVVVVVTTEANATDVDSLPVPLLPLISLILLLLFKLLKFVVLLIELLKTDKGSGAEILLISMFVFVFVIIGLGVIMVRICI
jgi:hypothetical protein